VTTQTTAQNGRLLLGTRRCNVIVTRPFAQFNQSLLLLVTRAMTSRVVIRTTAAVCCNTDRPVQFYALNNRLSLVTACCCSLYAVSVPHDIAYTHTVRPCNHHPYIDVVSLHHIGSCKLYYLNLLHLITGAADSFN